MSLDAVRVHVKRGRLLPVSLGFVTGGGVCVCEGSVTEGKSKFILGGPVQDLTTNLDKRPKCLLASCTLSTLMMPMFYMIKGRNIEPDFNFHYNSTAFETYAKTYFRK